VAVERRLPGECTLEIGWLAGRLVKRQRGPDHRCVIGSEAGHGESASPPGMAEAVALGHVGIYEQERARGHFEPRRLIECQTSIGKRSNHQAVPVREYFVIEARPHPLLANSQQFFAQRREPLFILYAAR
jgi:hypothetical protein